MADRERDLAKFEAQVEQLQLARERQAAKTAELEKDVEMLTRQRDAQDSAAAEAAARLSDDVRNLRVALDETGRRERQVIIVITMMIKVEVRRWLGPSMGCVGKLQLFRGLG